jgi:MYXO-CTERM domain-containing protein
MRERLAMRKTARIGTLGAAAGLLLVAFSTPAWGASGSFTKGDVVVYEVGTSGGATPSSTSGPISLVEYNTSGTPSGFTVALPTADSGSTHALTDSGSATYDGELTLSGDGTSLIATGYDAAAGVAKITSATGTPRTVAVVSGSGTVDTSTSLTDSTTEGQNFRSATSVSGASVYLGGGAGIGLASDGSTSATYLNADAVHEVQIVGNQLYESTTSAINQIGTGLPTATNPTESPLIASPPSKFEPAQFALVTVGSGSSPNTLYVADTGNNAIEKYSLVSNVWTLTGSVTADQVTGLTASVSNGVATVYATAATSAGAAFNSLLVSVTDSSGFDGSLTGATVSTLVTAPTGVSFKGVAFSPTPSGPPAETPEASSVLLLPLLGVVALGGVAVVRRRRSSEA